MTSQGKQRFRMKPREPDRAVQTGHHHHPGRSSQPHRGAGSHTDAAKPQAGRHHHRPDGGSLGAGRGQQGQIPDLALGADSEGCAGQQANLQQSQRTEEGPTGVGGQRNGHGGGSRHVVQSELVCRRRVQRHRSGQHGDSRHVRLPDLPPGDRFVAHKVVHG